MSKNRKSVTIDTHLAKEIDRRNEINFSALVNDLVEHYLAGEADTHKRKTSLEVRLEHVESEIDEKEKRLEQLKERRDELQELIEEHEGYQDPMVEKALKKLQGTLDHKLHPENDAVLNWSGKTGIPPEDLIEQVKDYEPQRDSI